jgi:hypothetical protein
MALFENLWKVMQSIPLIENTYILIQFERIETYWRLSEGPKIQWQNYRADWLQKVLIDVIKLVAVNYEPIFENSVNSFDNYDLILTGRYKFQSLQWGVKDQNLFYKFGLAVRGDLGRVDWGGPPDDRDLGSWILSHTLSYLINYINHKLCY